MFPLAVGVAVVGLGALGTLGQLVAALAALETLEDRDPQRLVLIDVFLRFGAVARRLRSLPLLSSKPMLQGI